MGEKLSFWPRAGIEYHDVSWSDVGNGSGSITQFAFEAEAIARHLALEPLRLHGRPDNRRPAHRRADDDVHRHRRRDDVVVDSAMFQVGLSAGMLGHF